MSSHLAGIVDGAAIAAISLAIATLFLVVIMELF
jgi:hypothetical protein